MSGGSYDYVYSRVTMFADDLAAQMKAHGLPLDRPYPDEPHERYTREAFLARGWLAVHLDLIAEAMEKVEWVDSGDCGPDDEVTAIRAVMAHTPKKKP